MSLPRFFLHRPCLIILVFFLLIAGMLPGVFSIGFDNTPDIFLQQDTEAIRKFREFERDFPDHRSVYLVCGGDLLWSRRGLDWIAGVERDLAKLPGVIDIVGPANLSQLLWFQWPADDPGLFKKEILEKKFRLLEGMFDPDGKSMMFQVWLRDAGEQAHNDTLGRIERLVADAPEGIRVSLAGLPVFQRMLDQSLFRMIFSIYPLLMVLGFLFLFFVFRNLWFVWIPLVFVLTVQILLYGIFGYSGGDINIVNVILSPIIFVVSLATVIQILIQYRHLMSSGMTCLNGLKAAYRHKGKPVLWTGMTTLLAFGSLMTADLPILRSMGFWSALGIGIMTLMAFSVLPALIIMVPRRVSHRPRRGFERGSRSLGRGISRWAVRHHLMVWTALGITTLFMVNGIGKVRIEENLNKYFSRGHPGFADLQWMEQLQMGMVTADLVVKYRDNVHGFRHPVMLSKLSRLSRNLQKGSLFKHVLGAGDLLDAAVDEILVDGEVTESIQWLALGALQSMDTTRRILGTMISQDGLTARITMRLPVVDYEGFLPHLRNAVSGGETIFPGADIWVTGYFPLILYAQQTLSRSLIVALLVTLMMVVLVFFLLIKNISLTILVTIPNLWPVVVIFGSMGMLGIPIDSATILTGAVVLGVAVDDSIHTLVYFSRIHRRYGSEISILKAIERLSPAHILTSVILVLGFLLCTVSDLLPVSRMAAVSAMGIGMALIGDLIIIPAVFGKISPGILKKK